MEYRTADELTRALDEILLSPSDAGAVALIVRRPAEGERETLDEGMLDLDEGLVGDGWIRRGTPSLEAQLTLMNIRAADAIAGSRERCPLAGDQIYVDLDLGVENLPIGTRLALGDAVIEVTPEPHTGCAKFTERFGSAAIRFVNKSPGRELRLRGVNTRVVTAGAVRVGDSVAKL